MKQNRLFACPEPLEGGEDSLTVFFCIPDTPGWRQTITALIGLLSYGRSWDESTGNIKNTQEIGKEIFESMSMCDIQTELAAIKVALETMADNTPRLFTPSELATILDGTTALDFEQVEALLNILGVLPGIKIDPIKYLFEWIWRSQMLSNAYAQSTAQSTMAAALAKGLGIEAIENVIEALGTGTDTILDIITGGSTAITGLAALIALFRDDQQGETLKMLQDINTSVQTSSTVNVTTECGKCGSSSGCNCNPEVDGPAADGPAAIAPSECCMPSDWVYFQDWENYLCNAANFYVDTFTIATQAIHLLYNRFMPDLLGITEEGRLGVTQIYQRIATALPEMIDPVLLFNMPNNVRSELITELTDRYVQTQDAVIANVPEIQTVEDVIGDYWTDDFAPVVQWMQDNADAKKQEFFQHDDPPDLLSNFTTFMNNAAVQAIGVLAGGVPGLLTKLASQGLANMAYSLNDVINEYASSYQCTGTRCLCTHEAQAGTEIANNQWSSENFGTYEQVLIAAYNVGCDEGGSGPEVRVTLTEKTGYSPSSEPADYRVEDGQGVEVYSGNTVWPSETVGRFFEINSATAFTVTMDFQEVC